VRKESFWGISRANGSGAGNASTFEITAQHSSELLGLMDAPRIAGAPLVVAFRRERPGRARGGKQSSKDEAMRHDYSDPDAATCAKRPALRFRNPFVRNRCAGLPPMVT